MVIASRLAIYDPLQLPESDFLESFIARQETLERQLRHVRHNYKATMCRHSMIVGQRGMGKTSLLRRISLAVRDDEKLCLQWIPLNFREEQYNVAQLPQLWANCADSLAEWCQLQGDIDSADQLDEAQHNPGNLWRIIEGVTHKHGRRLLLLIDNFDLVLDGLSSEDQWGLREILQKRDGPMLLACSSVMPLQFSEREGAFYEFVSYESLRGLSSAELRGCLYKLATIRGDAGKQVLEQLGIQSQRIDVLHNLCGGNPRTLTIIYQVLESLSSGINQSSSDLLEAVLESATPLYKARTEELSQQLRRVFDAIALSWDPIHSSDVAEVTNIPSGSISPQLKRLEQDGLIEKVQLDGKRKGYQLVERFYNIWYLMRHGNRRSRERLRWLTQFLSMYYDKNELELHARQMVSQRADRNAVSEAFLYAMEESPVKEALRRRISFDLGAEASRVRESVIDYSHEVLNHTERLVELASAFEGNAKLKSDPVYFGRLLARSFSLRAEEKDEIVRALPSLTQRQVDDLVRKLEEEFDRNISTFGESYRKLAHALEVGELGGSDDTKGALALLDTCDSTSLQYTILALFPLMVGLPEFAKCTLAVFPEDTAIEDARVLNQLGNLLIVDLERYEEAERAYRLAIELDSDFAFPWNGLGNLLRRHSDRHEEAEQAYLRAIEIDAGFVFPWNGLGNLLQTHLNRFEEAEHAYRRAIELDRNFAHPWSGLGNLLHAHLNRFEEAEQAYRRAIELDGGSVYAWNGLGNLLHAHLNRFEEAEQAYRRAIEIDEGFVYAWNGLGQLLLTHFIRIEEAERVLRRAIEIDPSDYSVWNSLGILLLDVRGLPQAAREAWQDSIDLNPENSDVPKANIAWSDLFTGRSDHAGSVAENIVLPKPGGALLSAGILVCRGNPGGATSLLSEVFGGLEPELWSIFRDDLLRLTRLFRLHGFDQFYIDWLIEQRIHIKQAPYVTAVRAFYLHESELKLVSPEIRQVAEPMYHWLKHTDEVWTKNNP